VNGAYSSKSSDLQGLCEYLGLLKNAIQTLKLSVSLQCLYLILYIVKHIAICQAQVAKKTKVATKLMKIVLFCTRFKLNEP
jgi:hypothetical protein